ncbi:MAG: MBOAT family protein [Rhodocyclaceae bacterium]|nr:MBOAT family protein [Rhodocyclaceae bacterium]MDZ4213938.1 MBOAT family protein [Rhodocyclaceae bacterium]
MLFNTFSFVLIFLPLALLGYFVLSKYSLRLSVVFLFLASLVFYAYWDIAYLPLLLGSIATNYLVGIWISREKAAHQARRAKLALILGLVFNLGLLSVFKYLDFFVVNLAWLTGADLKPPGILLPIGISFFTFTQIAYLVDCHAAKVSEYKPENYGLFVTYFPHLIAGPILHHKDMMPQFDRVASHVFLTGRLVVGMTFFTIGLFKKVVLADGVAPFVAPVFDLGHAQLTSLEAWCGALAYTFQLYFDFSAYSDMAYGLSYMFGVILPINFNSPYKARSIIDFWRRWHITLSIFLRDYLYFTLGGNRHGELRRYANLLITMLLGGLWHGASWTFVIWGALHGVYLVINHGIRHFLGERQHMFLNLSGWLLTFVAVVVGWVFFRATSLPIAIDVLSAMVGGTYLGDSGEGFLGGNRIMALDECMIWLLASAAIVFFAPNAYDMLGRGIRHVEEGRLSGMRGGLALGALLTLMFLLLAISETRGISEFLYFNF